MALSLAYCPRGQGLLRVLVYAHVRLCVLARATAAARWRAERSGVHTLGLAEVEKYEYVGAAVARLRAVTLGLVRQLLPDVVVERVAALLTVRVAAVAVLLPPLAQLLRLQLDLLAVGAAVWSESTSALLSTSALSIHTLCTHEVF